MRTIVYVEGNSNDLNNVLNVIKDTWHRDSCDFLYSLSSESLSCKEMISEFHEISNTIIINPIIVTNEVILLQEVQIEPTMEDTNEVFIVNYKDDRYNFYNIKKYYPNIRKVNNIMKMYLSGTFNDFLGD